MILEHALLPVRPGTEDEFVEAFAEAEAVGYRLLPISVTVFAMTPDVVLQLSYGGVDDEVDLSGRGIEVADLGRVRAGVSGRYQAAHGA